MKKVIWLYGLSGTGKTTIGKALVNTLKKLNHNAVLVDGDQIRDLFGSDLGFDLTSRMKQIDRVRKFVKILNDQEVTTIVAALYMNEEISIKNREQLQGYFDVYIETSIETLKERDTKKLYNNDTPKKTANIVGMDIPWNPPKNPNLKVSTTIKTVDEIIDEILKCHPELF